jgi:four helix bundle protein
VDEVKEEGEKGLEALQVWQRSIKFAEMICINVIPALPVHEKWALASQLRRAVQRIPANIAEGHGRYYYQDDIRFCYIARGSLEETFSHITLAHRLGYLNDGQYNPLLAEIKSLRRMLNGYIAHLKRSRRGADESGATIRENPARYAPYSEPFLDDG